MEAVRPLVSSTRASGLQAGTRNTRRAGATAHSAKPPKLISATGWPGAASEGATSGAAAATTPTDSKPAGKGSAAVAAARLAWYRPLL